MKTNREIRKETAGILAAGWFMRILGVFAAMYAIVAFSGGALVAMMRDLEVQTWGDFLVAKAEYAMKGVPYSVSSGRSALMMSGATLFQQFMMFIVAAIMMFGLARVSLKAARGEGKGWFASSFGGFARPLSVAWLLFRVNIQAILWSLLLVVPGVVAAYRYRLAWYLKSDNPDWSAGKCIAESARRMRGFKWQAFKLDISYFWRFALATLAVMAVEPLMRLFLPRGGGDSTATLVAVSAALVVAALFFFAALKLGFSLLAARAVFYRAMPAGNGGELPPDED